MYEDSGEIGARARMVRRRRGLSLDTVAGLTGISKSYLSRLESGERSFTRRGLIEDLAEALGCSPVDLTGLPTLAPDARAVAAASAIPGLSAALHDTTLDGAALAPGERDHMHFHFGPANVAAWSLAVAVEAGNGPEEAERLDNDPIDFTALGSAERQASAHFDLARAYAQGEGLRDTAALEHLDRADRIAPLRIRQDPMTRELVTDLDRRARRRVWELDSLKHRVGIA